MPGTTTAPESVAAGPASGIRPSVRGGRSDVTRLVGRARDGGSDDRAVLFDAVHDELRALAGRVRRPGGDATLSPTALVSELFIEFKRRFPPPPRTRPESRATFYRSAALAMRSILRDHWRARTARCRRPDRGVRPLAGEPADRPATDFAAEDFLALDEALDRLRAFHPRWYEVVLHRYFVQRSAEETAELLEVSRGTVVGDWRLARSWLRQELEG